MVVMPRSRSRRRGLPGVSGADGTTAGGSTTDGVDVDNVAVATVDVSDRVAEVDGGVAPITTGEVVTDLSWPTRRGVMTPATRSAAEANELERDPKKFAARRAGDADTGAKKEGCQVASIESWALGWRGD
jgi:hypothetical protein